MKKLINRVEDVLNEQLQGLAKAHPQLTLHQDPLYVTRADAPVAMSQCTAAISARGCFLAPARGKSSPRRRQIKCSNARCRLTAAKASC